MLLAVLFLLSFCSANAEYPNLIASKKITGNKLTIKPNAQLKKYLRASYFFVEYDFPEINLETMDFSIVSIPFITTMIPIIWISGDTYSIECMDYDLFYALEEIKKVFKLFFPTVSWSGKLIPKKIKKNCSSKQDPRLGILFSGGLDAIASSFAHFDQDQLLITLCGSDIKVYERRLWDSIKKQTIDFAQTYNKSYSFIRSNFAQIPNGKILKKLSGLPQWWALTSQALHYIGLTAPLLFHYGIKQLVIGSSHTADLPMPYGSHPLIDNALSFAGISVFHDLGDLDRPHKIKLVCKKCKKYSVPYPKLRVCWGNDKAGGNCCKCEKCLRTINELLVLGKKPQKFGFDIEPETACLETKQFFHHNRHLKARQLWHWECVQNYIKYSKITYKSPLDGYCEWLSRLHLEDFAKNSFELNSWKNQDPELTELWHESIKNQKFLFQIH